jgi:hypothetical protein
MVNHGLIMVNNWNNVGKTMENKPPMTGNGFYIPPINMVMTGGWFMTVFYPHYSNSGNLYCSRHICLGLTFCRYFHTISSYLRSKALLQEYNSYTILLVKSAIENCPLSSVIYPLKR